MESFTVCLWVICLTLVLIILEPLLPQAVDLVLQSYWLWVRTQITKARLYVPLAIQRRSFRNDYVGRLLRAVDLWRIRNNPAFHEFFDNDHPDD